MYAALPLFSETKTLLVWYSNIPYNSFWNLPYQFFDFISPVFHHFVGKLLKTSENKYVRFTLIYWLDDLPYF